VIPPADLYRLLPPTRTPGASSPTSRCWRRSTTRGAATCRCRRHRAPRSPSPAARSMCFPTSPGPGACGRVRQRTCQPASAPRASIVTANAEGGYMISVRAPLAAPHGATRCAGRFPAAAAAPPRPVSQPAPGGPAGVLPRFSRRPIPDAAVSMRGDIAPRPAKAPLTSIRLRRCRRMTDRRRQSPNATSVPCAIARLASSSAATSAPPIRRAAMPAASSPCSRSRRGSCPAQMTTVSAARAAACRPPTREVRRRRSSRIPPPRASPRRAS